MNLVLGSYLCKRRSIRPDSEAVGGPCGVLLSPVGGGDLEEATHLVEKQI